MNTTKQTKCLARPFNHWPLRIVALLTASSIAAALYLIAVKPEF